MGRENIISYEGIIYPSNPPLTPPRRGWLLTMPFLKLPFKV
jgi:hypothetical protein